MIFDFENITKDSTSFLIYHLYLVQPVRENSNIILKYKFKNLSTSASLRSNSTPSAAKTSVPPIRYIQFVRINRILAL